MGVRMTREEFLEKVFQKKYDELKDKDLRIVRIKVKGKEISLAQLIGSSETRIYQNLALHIGTHAGEDHTGESIGLIHVTPE
jgi:ethanolamine utilization protein EutS